MATVVGMKKVFISSVMRGFGDEREASRKAVESLRMTPVMAETFGAKPHSSQLACLEGVRASDIYVLVLGAKYGFVAQSGLSVTEEEFNEARQRGLPILAFVQKVEREPKQQEFFDRLGRYEAGYFVAFFNEPNELQTKVTTALHDLAHQPGVATMTPDQAAAHSQRHLGIQARGHQTIVGAVVFPVRYGEEYVPVLQMGEKDFQDAVAQRAMFGKAAIFRPQQGYSVQEGRDYVEFAQGGEQTPSFNRVQIHADGTLVSRASVDPTDRDMTYSLVRQFVINQDEVVRRLTGFLAFADAQYSTLEASPLITSLYLSVALSNLNQKYLGRWPESEPRGGMQLGMSPIDDPLVVPQSPLKISRAELANGAQLVEKAVAFLLRAFRTSGREYGQDKLPRW
jgi:hypothetical protein